MRSWLLLLPLLALPGLAGEMGAEALDRLTARYRAYVLENDTGGALRAGEYLRTLREDGTWADVEYRSPQRAAWPTGLHASRLLAMAIAWRRGGRPDAAPEALLAGIRRAFAHWRAQDYQCPNWWYNQIGGPMHLLTLGIVLGEALQPEEYAYLTQTVLPRAKIGMTGQNRVWLAGNTLMGGILLRDAALIDRAAEAIFAEVVVTGKEGIQPDYSFHQHGAQQQFGNYGLSFAADTAKWGEILRDTPWALPEAKRLLLRRYLLEGSVWTAWRGKLDISACGRQLSVNSPAAKATTLSRVLAVMARVDPEQAAAYTAAVARNAPGAANDLVGNRVFWRSDYLIHRRPAFCVTVKLSSARVIGVESLNSENLSGYYLADGACYLYRSGEEYAEIFPVWNWRQLPGVTCPQGAGPLPAFSRNNLPTAWVGGVSDGRNGGMAAEYTRLLGTPPAGQAEDRRLAAKKAWFCFDDQVVCLGAGITAGAAVADPLLTTVNQCLLRGPVRASAGGAVQTLAPGAAAPPALDWVEHDGVRYRFLGPQPVVLATGPRTGNWRAVRQTGDVPKDDITRDLFHLAVDHGVRPAGGSYAYVLQPADPDRQPAVELLANTPQLQAARAGTRIQAAFYGPGALRYGPDRTLMVDAPCLLLLDTATHRVHVADPLHARRSLTITLDGQPREVALPQGERAGSTVEVAF